ncbi:MAG TPA: DUF6159 family protein, partial [Candidatus Thermoplasmatota archaeon]|nr:DUF6159 family protein [Candidatus Thermoplasmatota archaeon]
GFLGWAAASYFVFPILAVERERSALAALRGSAAIARKQWGKTTAGILTLGLAVMVPMVVVSLVLGMAFMAAMTSALDGGPGRLYLFAYLGTTLAVMVGGMAVSQAATTAYQTALYRYAKTRRIPAPFDRATLVDAWKPYRNG